MALIRAAALLLAAAPLAAQTDPAAPPRFEGRALIAVSDALEQATSALTGTGFSGKASLADRLGTVESQVSTARVNAQSDAAIRNGQADTIWSRLAADGVDSDAEMQRLLQYEQAYAANARVIQAIQTMMDQILGI